MKKLPLTTLLLVGLIYSAFAQADNFHIHGLIRDQETREPIPFANISILNSTRGTAANEKGEFDLMIREPDFNQSLRISSIGFLSRTISIEAATPNNLLLIELQSDIKLLREIEISQKPINPIEIVKAAIDSVSKNYNANRL